MIRKRGWCVKGCGRTVNKANGTCEPCRRNEPPPRPNVNTLPLDYLVSCVEELQRRRLEINTALAKVTP